MGQPQFKNLDGMLTTELRYTTSQRFVILEGTLGENVVDLEVSVGGRSFSSDPSLFEFEQGEFTIPNLDVYPKGIPLSEGTHRILVRSIRATGNVSSESVATIQVLRPDQLDLAIAPPTGLRVRRHRNSVELVWAKIENNLVEGYNIYASTASSGGSGGYRKVNAELIETADFKETERLQQNQDRTQFESDLSGSQIRTTYIEEDAFDEPLQVIREGVLEEDIQGGVPLQKEIVTTVNAIDETEFFTFEHNRQDGEEEGILNSEFWRDVPPTEPLYYVITAVGEQPETRQQAESVYSSELVGQPLPIDTENLPLDAPEQFEISQNIIQDLLDEDSNLSAIPGSVSRDLFIDPFSSEMERVNFIADFIHRSQSFETLIPIDDPNGDGETDPVAEAPYKLTLKSAMGFESDREVQSMIDSSFDALAANYNTDRRGAEPAVGEATFFTFDKPTVDKVVEEGTIVSSEDGVQFRVTSRVTMDVDQFDSYFNHRRQRWEIKANIEAQSTGTEGNVAPGAITQVSSGTTLNVENEERTRFGQDSESNQDLAERARLSFVSVDSGTKGGYRDMAIENQGVFQANEVIGEDPLMMRDFDEVRMEHVGGKVDLWIRGQQAATQTEQFSLHFQRSENVPFKLVSKPSELLFVVEDPQLSPSNPIGALLGETPVQKSRGFGVRNATTGKSFDLTGYSVVDYNRVRLNSNIQQPKLQPNDTVLGDFRFLQSDTYRLQRQPVEGINEFVRTKTGDSLERGVDYEIVQDDDPLLEGQSIEANTRVRLLTSSATQELSTQTINDERHVLVGEIEEPLDNLGVVPSTIRVFDITRSTEYDGPDQDNPDYFLVEGSQTETTELIRNPDGDIDNGEQVSVDYRHDENFRISYTVNRLVEEVQETVEEERHATADALVKESVEHPIEIEATVVLDPTATQTEADIRIRSELSNLLNFLRIGQALHQSDIIQAIESVQGVDYVVTPLAKIARTDGTLVVREPVSPSFRVVDTFGNRQIVVAEDALNAPTIPTGGEEKEHRGVFRDKILMDSADQYIELETETDLAYISGDSGLSISGFSDDQTLMNEGFEPDEFEEERRRRTANRIFLSVSTQDTPSDSDFAVSYHVYNELGSRDIEVSDVSHVELGDLTLTFRGGN